MEWRLVAFVLRVVAVVAIVLYPQRRRNSEKDSEINESAPSLEPSPKIIDLNRRVPVPKRRGRTPAQIQADETRYNIEMRARSQYAFERIRGQAGLAGSKRYIWRTCGDADVCSTCAKKEGKRFAWDVPPPRGGHPGDCADCSVGFCRCYAEPVLPRL